MQRPAGELPAVTSQRQAASAIRALEAASLASGRRPGSVLERGRAVRRGVEGVKRFLEEGFVVPSFVVSVVSPGQGGDGR